MPTRILVVSDTHIADDIEQIPEIIREQAKKSDCCIHAGDFISLAALQEFQKWTKIYGVCGNMDSDEIRERLPYKQIISFESVRLALTHGRGHADNLINHINNEFSDEIEKIDIFVFGHSHSPINKFINNKLYFNPGSLTDTVSSSYCSYGILEINGSKIKGKVVELE
ncbi:MAG: metallophosphoesterase [Candidatus Omnitrophica bacterium]|nr:metallophosphoesterase [Candidatus Omnitrophota bacterium]MDD5429721.1 metallophosphoesterase [Candidatus Omnitrophota bacterium]